LVGYEDKPKLALFVGYWETYSIKAQSNGVDIIREKPFVQGKTNLDFFARMRKNPTRVKCYAIVVDRIRITLLGETPLLGKIPVLDYGAGGGIQRTHRVMSVELQYSSCYQPEVLIHKTL